jgi:transducin (beta)-like 1
MSLTSEEVNFLIFRYLQESGMLFFILFLSPVDPTLSYSCDESCLMFGGIGFVHSAFTFGAESLVYRSNIAATEVPPGALVAFIQKGIQYLEIEASLAEDDVPEHGHKRPMDLLKPQRTRLKTEQLKPAPPLPNAIVSVAAPPSLPAPQTAAAVPMELDHENESSFGADDVHVLRGHESEVFVCAWNPNSSVLATGSSDATARLWSVPNSSASSSNGSSSLSSNIINNTTNNNNNNSSSSSGMSSSSSRGSPTCITLNHVPSNAADKCRDVTALDWSADGRYLVSGAFDGQCRVFQGSDGALVVQAQLHKGPVLSVKCNKHSQSQHLVLSASSDKTVLAWDLRSAQIVQAFAHHEGAVLDCDWRDATVFASCSVDRTVVVSEVGRKEPLRVFEGHAGEVTGVEWDASGRFLASASDDHTAKIWSLERGLVWDLQGHDREVSSMRWSADGLFATGSSDGSIRVWDVNRGQCVAVLREHVGGVHTLAFSQDGLLVSGGADRKVKVWNVREGRVVKSFDAGGDVFKVRWSGSGDRIAACVANGTVDVLDWRR